MNRESGQALLVVLLIMSVVATVVLSTASRSVTDIAISQKEEESIRAFSAAEAGVEKALVAGTGQTGTLDTGGTFAATVTEIGQGSSSFKIPLPLRSGESGTVWFVDHDTNGNLTCNNNCSTAQSVQACWGDQSERVDATQTAVEVSVYYTDSGGTKVARAAFDPNAGRAASNSFSNSVTTGDNECGLGFPYSASISLPNPRSSTSTLIGPQFARIKAIYNTDGRYAGATVNVGVLPRQGIKIESAGTAGSSNRKIVVQRPFADLPPIFDFGLFSGSGDLVK